MDFLSRHTVILGAKGDIVLHCWRDQLVGWVLKEQPHDMGQAGDGTVPCIYPFHYNLVSDLTSEEMRHQAVQARTERCLPRPGWPSYQDGFSLLYLQIYICQGGLFGTIVCETEIIE